MMWKRAAMRCGVFGESNVESFPCEVSMGTSIVVSYDDGRGPVVYRGDASALGHFRLAASERQGEATLHGLVADGRLEGTWTEEGRTGWWVVELGAAEKVAAA